jgi:RNA polymerase sigma-70 factor, ECF subfamily
MQSLAAGVDTQGTLPVPAARDFTQTFRDEFPRLAGYCAGLVGDRDLGGELAQEALTRTWGRWTSVRDPHAYAFLVATNLARKAWRDRQRKALAVEKLSAEDKSRCVWPADDSMLDLVERLPAKLRDPVLLHYYADLPAEQVARLLRRPAGTIRQRLHQARQLLATMLEEN